MYELKKNINLANHEAKSLGRKRRYRDMDKKIDEMREMEMHFNDAKKENLKALMHSFHEKKHSNPNTARARAKRELLERARKAIGKLGSRAAVLRELEIHAKYLPQASGIQKKLAAETRMHSDGKTLTLTGDMKTDSVFQQRALTIERLRQRINFIRGELTPKSGSIEEMDYYIDAAREAERAFSDLKAKNFKLLMHFFHGDKT